MKRWSRRKSRAGPRALSSPVSPAKERVKGNRADFGPPNHHSYERQTTLSLCVPGMGIFHLLRKKQEAAVLAGEGVNLLLFYFKIKEKKHQKKTKEKKTRVKAATASIVESSGRRDEGLMTTLTPSHHLPTSPRHANILRPTALRQPFLLTPSNSASHPYTPSHIHCCAHTAQRWEREGEEQDERRGRDTRMVKQEKRIG